MKAPPSRHPGERKSGLITKEFLVGLVAIILGGYNLLPYIGVQVPPFEPPKIIANIVLVIAGLILWITAYRLWRYKWHTSRLF